MITKPSDHLEYDKRFRQWGKLVTATDIDLNQTNGYSLQGDWVKWTASVTLTPGRYLVVASEYGSMKYHSYHYCLIDGNGNHVDKDAKVAVIDAALVSGRITEEQRVKAENSVLYSYALYISLQ